MGVLVVIIRFSYQGCLSCYSRSNKEIAKELAEGTFIPAEGMSEELAIHENGEQRILSLDHMYFREPLSEKGISWDDLNKKSHETYTTNYTT